MRRYSFDRKFAVVFFGVKLAAVFERFALDKISGLFVIEPDCSANAFHSDHLTEIGKPLHGF